MYDNGEGSDDDKGDGVFTCSFFVPEDAPTGAYELTITARDRSDRTGSAAVSLRISDPNPSPRIGAVEISPRTVAKGGYILITADVSDPDGASNIRWVTCDLSPLGGSEEQDLYDDGTNGDGKAGDGTYSLSFKVSQDVAEGVQAVPIRAEDLEGNSGSSEAEVTVEASEGPEQDEGLPMLYIYIGGGCILVIALVLVILFFATRPKKAASASRKATPAGRTGKATRRHEGTVVRVRVEEPEDFEVYEAAVVDE
jgi:hypothetical protein